MKRGCDTVKKPNPLLGLFASPIKDGMPEGPCPDCKSSVFWESRSRIVICVTCHPPASDRLVRSLIEIDLEEPESEQPEYWLRARDDEAAVLHSPAGGSDSSVASDQGER